MDNIKSFYYLSKTFGISPFSLQKIPQNRSIVDIMHSLPTFIAIAVYTICLSSIFYQSTNQSDISLAANWIQVDIITNFFFCIYLFIFIF